MTHQGQIFHLQLFSIISIENEEHIINKLKHI